MRKACVECAQKHLSTAAVYLTRAAVFSDSRTDHNYVFWLNKTVGEVGEAIDEIAQESISTAKAIACIREEILTSDHIHWKTDKLLNQAVELDLLTIDNQEEQHD